MHILFEEDGGFKAGTVLSDAGTSLQIELPSGKRIKVKASHVMLRFAEPAAGEFLQRAQADAEEIELDFLWECAPQQEFGFDALAGEYYGREPTPLESAALLLRLHGAPVYFYRKGRGRYRPAQPETLRAALAAIERRRQQQLAVEAYAEAMAGGELPDAMRTNAAQVLFAPDKNGVEYKALVRAAELAQQPPERLLLGLGAFESPRALHVARFRHEHFPRGTEFGPIEFEPSDRELPAADVVAFSIDDSTTTEIDDCLSVSPRPDGGWRVGVHIAVPALAIRHDDPLDRLARGRMSTVYAPGEKITMLPAQALAAFSLDEGRELPALSYYVDVSPDFESVRPHLSRLERIRVATNLRHDLLDDLETEAALEDPGAQLPHGDALRVLWPLAQACTRARERVRGRPELRNRTDFTFYVDGETVRIRERRRDAPLDRIVAEMMILANSGWGRLLGDHATAGIYRGQQLGRVKMTPYPQPHAGLGVEQYAWCTSPLRRYVDLVNQRQILAVLDGEPPALAANDADLFSIISAFDAKHTAYLEYQARMERFWCLRWLAQHSSTRFEAVVLREDLARLLGCPLYVRLLSAPPLEPGRRVIIDVIERDEVSITIGTRVHEVLPASASLADDGAFEAPDEVSA
ncbi:MAG: RNB domain-containing ribonuclease [Burkholderiales bacterium]|nr:MAG: RNB domain-containing ribonuclease [Burkholderiales bacterium]